MTEQTQLDVDVNWCYHVNMDKKLLAIILLCAITMGIAIAHDVAAGSMRGNANTQIPSIYTPAVIWSSPALNRR